MGFNLQHYPKENTVFISISVNFVALYWNENRLQISSFNCTMSALGILICKAKKAELLPPFFSLYFFGTDFCKVYFNLPEALFSASSPDSTIQGTGREGKLFTSPFDLISEILKTKKQKPIYKDKVSQKLRCYKYQLLFK